MNTSDASPSYMQNRHGTIRKVRGADPLPDLSIEEQKAKRLRAGGFVALRIGFSKAKAEERVREAREHLKSLKATTELTKPADEKSVVGILAQEPTGNGEVSVD
jgi:hypothetical protein